MCELRNVIVAIQLTVGTLRSGVGMIEILKSGHEGRIVVQGYVKSSWRNLKKKLTNILVIGLLGTDGKSYHEEVVDAGRHLWSSLNSTDVVIVILIIIIMIIIITSIYHDC